MTLLITWPESGPATVLRRTCDPSAVAAALAPAGVRYERWPVRDDVPTGAGPEAVLTAYRTEVDRLTAEEGFATVDVVALHPDGTPGWRDRAKAAREKFLAEHTHDDDDEVRFFVAGAGVFYLHVNGEVHAVHCEKGDLLGVPRGTTHWFDMGTEPSFTAIRFFHQEDGWIGTFTGSDIASRFPSFDEIHAARPGRAA
ncbi:acireductone dioxygenase [Streptomyces sp. UNOC14_S4]|uniref:1,2-dihydroxy-3-keto-5-methylthiopentene dioxygenase n=1 Tax=Streptomyces sp. UNOC14_S4 TaxID=2872340 RepID=UPI001E297157|nr:cupin domain-containing protein [Streptomyces sp. UNOC14_S4]MCC3768681.1 cupin domain-containing protein [Streptomyces sp. UNOC14_S4]